MDKRGKTIWPALALLVMSAGLLTGCGTRTRTYGAARFITEPPGAEVINLKDDTNLGMTPVVVTWEGEGEQSEYVTVEFKKQGYREEITSLWVNKRHPSREAAEAEPQPITVQLQKRAN